MITEFSPPAIIGGWERSWRGPCRCCRCLLAFSRVASLAQPDQRSGDRLVTWPGRLAAAWVLATSTCGPGGGGSGPARWWSTTSGC
jgi:hypothetical protein